MRDEDIFNGVGIEVELPQREFFLKIMETLTRVGPLDEDGRLVQPCYILHKRNRYVIAHVHELQWLDGLNVEITDDDIAMRNRVAQLIASWKLASIIDEPERLMPLAPMSAVKVVAFRDKSNWELISPYKIGRVTSGRQSVLAEHG